ncbi:MAG: carbamoyltransferase, partial [Thermoleophilia bacterium]|nr:carbamoyltransferase [Thermoleophilia bacterium]
NILGINAYHGDASAALFVDGSLVAAVEEERFTRVKHDTAFPHEAIRYCLETAGMRPHDVEHIALSRDPFANLGKRVTHAVKDRAGRRVATRRASNLRKVLRAKQTFAEGVSVPADRLRTKTHFVEHHLAHIGSSFYVSPFERAAVLSIDGFGDMISAMWGVGEGGRFKALGEVAFPHSLGVYYTAVTQYLGFPKYGDEYKVMGLASYGQPTYLEEFRRIVHSSGLGYELGLDHFRHHVEGAAMTWDGGSPELPPLWGPGMETLLGPARRDADEPLEDRHRDIAASLQARLEEIVLGMLRDLHATTGLTALCLAGGVALNCVVNGKIFDETPFTDLYIQPAAYDGGTSVGAALHVQHAKLGAPRTFEMQHTYWGPEYSPERMRGALEAAGLPFEETGTDKLIDRTADALAEGGVVGWFQGRVEFGPRALGNRSILADPRRSDMQDTLNARIKHREPFRPFAPAILEERTGEWFEKSYPSPFMLLTYPVRPEKRDLIPAPTHVDGTGRLQTVRRDQNERYYDLIRAFENRTGVPVLLNTSFNENEPICCTPEQAVDTFVRTKMDLLVLGDLLCEKPAAG